MGTASPEMRPTLQEAGPSPLSTRVEEALAARGLACAFAEGAVAAKLGALLAELVEKGQVSGELLRSYGPSLDFSTPPQMEEVRAFIVVAARSPAVKVRFHLEDGPFEALIPPTYISASLYTETLRVLESVLGTAGHHVARARVPVKLLAVYAGLAQYGRNNIAYVRNLGSFVRLDAYCTDAPLVANTQPPRGSWRLSSCPPCRNCHHVCPTGCIPYDGTVIDATRCLTYLNEHEGEWPDWLDPSAHNALVGCMRCQEMCPADRFYLRLPKVVAEFDREETQWILRDLPAGNLPQTVLAKLQALDLDDYSPVLGRNLRALIVAEQLRGASRARPRGGPHADG